MGVTLRVLVAHLWVWGRGKGGSSRTWVFCLFVCFNIFIYLFIYLGVLGLNLPLTGS